MGAALFGAASVFMAYEGFQVLTYDYEDINDPDRTLPRAMPSAIVVVILVYGALAASAASVGLVIRLVRTEPLSLLLLGLLVLVSFVGRPLLLRYFSNRERSD